MPIHDMTMAIDENREKALQFLEQMKFTQTSALSILSARANAASQAGNSNLDIALTRLVTSLSRQNLTLANAKRAVLRTKSLAGPTARLAALVDEAERHRRNLDEVAQTLEAATRLIDVFRRLLGIFT